MMELANTKRCFFPTILLAILLLTAVVLAACGNSDYNVSGTYENVNGFAVMELTSGNEVAFTIYNKKVPCASYAVESDRVTLQCDDGPMDFMRKADGSLVTLSLETRGLSLPFRGPAGTLFGAFRKTH